MDQRRPSNENVNQPQDDAFDLELDEIGDDDALRAKRRPTREAAPEELLDLTFTKPGQSLHAPKSAYDRVTSTVGSRSTWSRIKKDFNQLGGQRKIIAKAVAGVAALLIALWLVRAVWRGVMYAVDAGTAAGRQVVSKLQPNMETIEESGQEIVGKVRRLWEEVQPEEDELAEVTAPKLGQATRVVGDPWPSRDEDLLTSADIVEPKSMIEELLAQKNAEVTKDGQGNFHGVFHRDGPMDPAKPAWIGGFIGVVQPGKAPKALLDGMVVQHAEGGDVLVAEFRMGKMESFWMQTGTTDKDKRVVYLRTRNKSGQPIPDGAAFVLAPYRTTSLAFAYEDGAPVGGQWCTKMRDETGRFVFSPPADIASLSELRAKSPESRDYVARLEQAIAQLPDLPKKANAALQQYVREKRK